MSENGLCIVLWDIDIHSEHTDPHPHQRIFDYVPCSVGARTTEQIAPRTLVLRERRGKGCRLVTRLYLHVSPTCGLAVECGHLLPSTGSPSEGQKPGICPPKLPYYRNFVP